MQAATGALCAADVMSVLHLNMAKTSQGPWPLRNHSQRHRLSTSAFTYQKHRGLAAAQAAEPITTEQEHQGVVTVTRPDDHAAIVRWFTERYGLTYHQQKDLTLKLTRSEAALEALPQNDKFVGDEGPVLLLERDMIPKAELLDELSPRLGWKVMCRYPEEFVNPYAIEYWSIMAAFLYTIGYPADRIEKLFRRHICLFARTVQDPANLRALFDWFRQLGLQGTDVARLIDKHPLLLQSDLEGVLKPRVQFMQDMGLPLSKVVAALKRVPELLGVDSSVLQQTTDYLTKLGLSQHQVGSLFAAQPAVFACSVQDKLEPIVNLLETELGCQGALLLRMVATSGLLSRSLATIRARAEHWREDLGLGQQGLLQALQRFPRLLLYPMDEPKYRKKVQFMVEELKLAPTALALNPQYVSYSLGRRIAPRTAAVRALAGKELTLYRLAQSDEAFCAAYGIELDAFQAFVADWSGSEEAHKWKE